MSASSCRTGSHRTASDGVATCGRSATNIPFWATGNGCEREPRVGGGNHGQCHAIRQDVAQTHSRRCGVRISRTRRRPGHRAAARARAPGTRIPAGDRIDALGGEPITRGNHRRRRAGAGCEPRVVGGRLLVDEVREDRAHRGTAVGAPETASRVRPRTSVRAGSPPPPRGTRRPTSTAAMCPASSGGRAIVGRRTRAIAPSWPRPASTKPSSSSAWVNVRECRPARPSRPRSPMRSAARHGIEVSPMPPTASVPATVVRKLSVSTGGRPRGWRCSATSSHVVPPSTSTVSSAIDDPSQPRQLDHHAASIRTCPPELCPAPRSLYRSSARRARASRPRARSPSRARSPAPAAHQEAPEVVS